MIIDTFNLSLLRVFESVYRSKSMTKAAQELHMTQSGVSQNIKNLEDMLGMTLFDRVKQRPIPTQKAQILFQACMQHLHGLESTLISLTGNSQSLSGEVVIGLPLEFGNNIVIPLLAKLGSLHPLINFQIKYGHASELNSLLLRGEMDFAFIDTFAVDKQINTEQVAVETLVLCCGMDFYQKKVKGQKQDAKFFQRLEYVDYVEGAPVLKMWFRHHFKQDTNCNIRALLMDVHGMSRIITENLGAGILPSHVVDRLGKTGHELYVFNGSGDPLKNSLSLAYLEGRTLSAAALLVKNDLVEKIKSLH